MSRSEVWLLHISTLLVGGTGLVYALMLYFMVPLDEFSVVNHRWQPQTQHAHIWLAPLLVFAIGLIWRSHIWKHYSGGRRLKRRSGLTLLVIFVPMIVSGYLIQTAVGETWRTIWIGIHLATSAIFLLGYLLHRLAGSKRASASATEVTGAPV